MKRSILMIAAVLLLSNAVIAQKKKGEVKEKRQSDKFRTDISKLMPKIERLAIAQAVIHFKLTTTAKTIGGEKSTQKMAGARVSAYLEFTDGDMTQEEYDAIANHFYSYFQQKLKAGGIDTVGWSSVTAHEFYQKVSEDEETEKALTKEKGGNEWATASAHGGKVLHHGAAWFAAGKGKRSVEFAKDLQATAGIFELVLDFADVLVNVDIKSTEYQNFGNGWYRPATTKTTYTWAINPEMRIGNPDNTLPMLFTAKTGEYIMMWNDIESKATYAQSMTEDVSKARTGLAKQFAFRKELTPVLIQTTKANYTAAALKTVEAYADAFVEACQRVRKN